MTIQIPTKPYEIENWHLIKTSGFIKIQEFKSVSLFQSFMQTIQTITDLNNYKYRIIINQHLVALGSSYLEIIQDFNKIYQLSENVLNADDVLEKIEIYCKHSTDLTLNIRNLQLDQTNIKIHTLFPLLPKNDLLINYYSCCLNSLVNIGWLYATQQSICYYSLILNKETKLLIKLINVTKLEMVGSEIIIKTNDLLNDISFYNLFNINETYALLVMLVDLCCDRLLLSTITDPLPGSVDNIKYVNKIVPDNNNTDDNKTDDITNTNKNSDNNNQSKKYSQIQSTQQITNQNFQQILQNKQILSLFPIPSNEQLLQKCNCVFSIQDTRYSCYGKIYLSSTFICFTSSNNYTICVIPYFTIKRLEKLNSNHKNNFSRHKLNFFSYLCLASNENNYTNCKR